MLRNSVVGEFFSAHTDVLDQTRKDGATRTRCNSTAVHVPVLFRSAYPKSVLTGSLAGLASATCDE